MYHVFGTREFIGLLRAEGAGRAYDESIFYRNVGQGLLLILQPKQEVFIKKGLENEDTHTQTHSPLRASGDPEIGQLRALPQKLFTVSPEAGPSTLPRVAPCCRPAASSARAAPRGRRPAVSTARAARPRPPPRRELRPSCWAAAPPRAPPELLARGRRPVVSSAKAARLRPPPCRKHHFSVYRWRGLFLAAIFWCDWIL
jgi:hypothetical protein